MKHKIELTDIESLVVLDALNLLRQNPIKNDIDKSVADRVAELILSTVKNDKQWPVKATYNKCGDCKWLSDDNKSSVGYLCENPIKEWRTSTACWHSRSCKACKEFEKEQNNE